MTQDPRLSRDPMHMTYRKTPTGKWGEPTNLKQGKVALWGRTGREVLVLASTGYDNPEQTFIWDIVPLDTRTKVRAWAHELGVVREATPAELELLPLIDSQILTGQPAQAAPIGGAMSQQQGITQGEWMARNLERMVGVLNRSIDRITRLATAGERETISRQLKGVSLELEIASEFSGLGLGAKHEYVILIEKVENPAEELDEPIARERLPGINEELTEVVLRVTALIIEERQSGSRMVLDAETARMTLFQAFQT